MSPLAWVAVYSVAVLLFSLAGGSVPLVKRVSHDRLQLYLSLSAGVMLGAACFHVLPDAVESLGPEVFGWWVAGGVVGLFCIERFLAPHSHEPNVPKAAAKEGSEHDHKHDQPHQHGHDHGHEHHAPVAPPVAGWAAVLGLTLHTFMNGVAMAGAVKYDLDHPGEHVSAWALPGLALFLAIVLHKPADALSISTVLRRRGVSSGLIGLVQVGFAAMVPVGGAAFLLTQGALAAGLENQITGAALAFSAGTFLFIALSDLLPEVHFHRHDRVPLFLALLAGVVLMGLIALLEPHEENKSGPEKGPAAPNKTAS